MIRTTCTPEITFKLCEMKTYMVQLKKKNTDDFKNFETSQHTHTHTKLIRHILPKTIQLLY